MKYLIEYCPRREVYDIYDMVKIHVKGSERERIMTLSHDEMDAAIEMQIAVVNFLNKSRNFV